MSFESHRSKGSRERDDKLFVPEEQRALVYRPISTKLSLVVVHGAVVPLLMLELPLCNKRRDREKKTFSVFGIKGPLSQPDFD
jgi:hypothetical protein